ncbi:EAL domain-containing protein [Marinomonas hwangdonensis]|uniref:EAL domain-containing protein n=1 Tax=Marinomonas hwangdonensis TaxID=1053647 RepID=A0A3M8Q4T8_9GAMM|nr:EAL domain-containing protein [Marinomonas hwangdonensis]RNF51116.1 EAL domain-containing protein [Marinomonas hwangdonensis]
MPSKRFNSSERRPRFFELKFTTRIALVFGALGLLTLLVSMLYAYRAAEQSLDLEIHNALQQRQKTIENLVSIRLSLLDVYLQSSAANRIFSSIDNGNESGISMMAEDMAFMFQDSALGANLDIFFITNTNNELVYDAGLPLYDISAFFEEMRSPFLYANRWSLVNSGNLNALIKSVPLFDPATIQLKGYMFIGLAIGQNREFVADVAQQIDVDILKIGTNNKPWQRYSGVNFVSEPARFPLLGTVDKSNDVYLMRQVISLPNDINKIWAEVGLSADRFPSITETYQQTFYLLSGGFIVVLLIAASLIHISHTKNVARLMDFIREIQGGSRGVQYEKGGIKEYNQVGYAMQEMVHDLNIAATVFESAEGMIVTDPDQKILRVNRAFTEITGYSVSEALGRPLDFIQSDHNNAVFLREMNDALVNKGFWQGEVWNTRKNAEEYLQWISITAVQSESSEHVNNYVVTLIDATQRKAAENKITQLAFYDQLTGLPNRQLLMDRLNHAIAASVRQKRSGAILFIDLDDFKTLNDTRGHDAGDILLQQVADRLVNNVRKDDTVARIGGDEFIILLEDLDEDINIASQQVELLAEQLLKSLSAPYRILAIEYFSTLSIGITLFQGDQVSYEELLKQADLAMYQSKAAGRNTRRFFDPSMQARVLEHAELANDVRKGMTNKEFVLFFQPQIDTNLNIIGAEALIRWYHPTRGLVTPGHFIDVVEETGLILPLGQWVLDRACQVIAQWENASSTKNLTLSVNISARQLMQSDFVEQVMASLKRSGANPQRLKLELTESMLLNDVQDTILKMNLLGDQGVSFSLDDFGTGYSSLSYLRQLPLEQLKIDQSFVQDLENQTTIAQTIVTLAKGLDMSVIAEGVETEEQYRALALYGCEAYQGFYFGRPMPLNDFLARVEHHLGT